MSDRAITFGRVPVVVDNPLLDAARLADPHIDARGRPRGWQLDSNWLNATEQRFRLAKRYAWGVPNQEAIEAIAALGSVVEIGAGTGYWASLLAAFGVDVVAYDERPGHNGWCDHACYHPVSVGGPADVERHPDRALFLCWPPMSEMAAESLALYAGRYVAYVGEYSGGCCADDAFFESLDSGWVEIESVCIPQWPGLHDALSIFERQVALPTVVVEKL